MYSTDNKLEHDVLKCIEVYQQEEIPIQSATFDYSLLISNVEMITDSCVRQHLRVLLHSCVEEDF